MAMTESRRTSFAEFFGGKEPTEFIYEDEQCVAFDEITNKQAPIHFLVVPKKVIISSLIEASVDDERLLGHILLVAKEIALRRGLDRTGYHVMVDEEYQTKSLKSLHVFGRALHHMVWPVGPGCKL